jgi:SAM-dependent methyltransferase
MGVTRLLRRIVPGAFRRRAALALLEPPVGDVDLGDLARLTPISEQWGFDRGTPIDRHYILEFLAAHAADIAGDVLEVDAPTYTRRFGGNRVLRSEVLHVEDDRPGVTMIGDLTRPEDFEPEQFDSVILTQTLQFIPRPEAAIRTVHRILRPGGVVLATFPGISKISREDMDRWGCHFNFTSRSAAWLFEGVFGPDGVTVDAAGNVLAAAAFLYGLAAEDLAPTDLAHRDRDFEVLLCVRAVRGA